jgi:hypothetical protein
VSKLLAEEAMLPVPPPLAPLPENWNPSTQEPNLDLVIRSRRTIDSKGVPCSAWEYAYALEGEFRAALNQPQRDYMATMLRHIAWLAQDNPIQTMSGHERVKHVGRKLRQEIRATADLLANVAFYLVEQDGWNGAASALGLRESEVRHMLKSRNKHPHLVSSKPTKTILASIEDRVLQEIKR